MTFSTISQDTGMTFVEVVISSVIGIVVAGVIYVSIVYVGDFSEDMVFEQQFQIESEFICQVLEKEIRKGVEVSSLTGMGPPAGGTLPDLSGIIVLTQLIPYTFSADFRFQADSTFSASVNGNTIKTPFGLRINPANSYFDIYSLANLICADNPNTEPVYVAYQFQLIARGGSGKSYVYPVVRGFQRCKQNTCL